MSVTEKSNDTLDRLFIDQIDHVLSFGYLSFSLRLTVRPLQLHLRTEPILVLIESILSPVSKNISRISSQFTHLKISVMRLCALSSVHRPTIVKNQGHCTNHMYEISARFHFSFSRNSKGQNGNYPTFTLLSFLRVRLSH